MLVQLDAGRDNHVDHPLLPREELDAGAGQQPGPTPPEQPDTTEGQLHRGDGAQPRHGGGDGDQVPGPPHRG